MAFTKIESGAIADGAVESSNLDSSVNDTINNVTVDTVFTGDSITVPSGGADSRPTPTPGMLRYNTETGLVENYNSVGWQGIDAPPTVIGIAGIINEDTDSTITVTGSNFKSGAVVYVEGSAVNGIPRPLTTSYISTGELQANTNASAQSFVGGAAFSVKVVNTSGLSGTLDPAGNIDRDPLWSTSSGSLGSFGDREDTLSIQLSASDPDGDSLSFSLASGSLPSGIILSSDGLISGNPSDVSYNTTYPFEVSVTANNQTVNRTFNISINREIGYSDKPGVSAQDIIDTRSISGATQVYVNPTGSDTFAQYIAGDLAELGTIPTGGPSWVYNHTGLNIVSRSIYNTTDTMTISYQRWLDMVEQSMARNTSSVTPYFYWAVFQNGSLLGITRTRFSSTSFTEWRDHHTGDFTPKPSQLDTSWDVWAVPSWLNYTISNDTSNHVRSIPYQNSTSIVGGDYNDTSYGLHYKRTSSGEHYPWRDSSGLCTSSGYFYDYHGTAGTDFAEGKNVPTSSNVVHYIYMAEN